MVLDVVVDLPTQLWFVSKVLVNLKGCISVHMYLRTDVQHYKAQIKEENRFYETTASMYTIRASNNCSTPWDSC